VPEDAGALLVRSGLIASDQLRLARQAQAGSGGTVGEHLVLAGFIDDEALADFYRSRLMVPQVKPEQLSDIPDWLIAKIPAEMAAEFRCVPVACEPDRHLTLAMADPSTTHAVDEISFFTGHYVVRAVATQRQIAWCLARYYGQVTPLAEKMTSDPSGGVGGIPPYPIPGASGPERSGPVERQAETAEAPARSQPGAGTRPAPVAAQNGGRLPLPAPMDDDLGDDTGSPVPVIIESDRPSPPPRPAYIPPETREPMISFLHEETAPTGPMRLLARRPTTQPPELRDRAGEFEVPTGPIQRLRSETLPPVVISPLLADPDRVPAERGPRVQLRPMDSQDVADPDMDYLPPEVLELPPPSGEEPMPLPPAPDSGAVPAAPAGALDGALAGAAPGAVSDAGEAAHATGPRALGSTRGNPDELVMLDRPKSDRRRHRRTRIGLGIAPSTLSRLTGTPHSLPGHGRTWSVASVTTEAPARNAPDGSAPDGNAQGHVTDGVPAAVGAVHEGVPGGELQPEQSVRNAAPETPTGPVRVRDAATGRWPRPGPVSSSAPDSIQAAARAAAEALRDAGRSQADASGPQSALAPGDVSQAVPNVVMDEAPPADTSAPAARPAPQPGYHGEELDDPRWGPPGTTIPPQFLGPLLYEVQDSGPSPVPLLTEHLPEEVSDADIDQMLNAGFDTLGPMTGASGDVPVQESGPARVRRSPARSSSPGTPGSRSTALTPAEVPATAMVAPPVTGPVLSFQGVEALTPNLVQALEDSSLRLVEILRELDQADDRNAVVDTLIQHLAESHLRVAFFVVKSGELTTWKQRLGKGPIERRDGIKLNLDEPSTFQDIVGTRLPFRGPLTDPVSRAFVAAALGFSAGEMLSLPVAVRGRVVGILYGDTETKRVFEQHLAVVTRAAGVALERILRARKGQ
jgi:hypothetical protein